MVRGQGAIGAGTAEETIGAATTAGILEVEPELEVGLGLELYPELDPESYSESELYLDAGHLHVRFIFLHFVHTFSSSPLIQSLNPSRAPPTRTNWNPSLEPVNPTRVN
jgi:hypothetical protein